MCLERMGIMEQSTLFVKYYLPPRLCEMLVIWGGGGQRMQWVQQSSVIDKEVEYKLLPQIIGCAQA
jgi:hypothetical protein